jgi:hypothetical protein
MRVIPEAWRSVAQLVSAGLLFLGQNPVCPTRRPTGKICYQDKTPGSQDDRFEWIPDQCGGPDRVSWTRGCLRGDNRILEHHTGESLGSTPPCVPRPCANDSGLDWHDRANAESKGARAIRRLSRGSMIESSQSIRPRHGRRRSEFRVLRSARPPTAHGHRRRRPLALSLALWRPAIPSLPDRD